MNWNRSRILSPLIIVTLCRTADTVAADDDFVAAIPAIAARRQIVVRPAQLEQRVFGLDARTMSLQIDDQIEQRIRGVSRHYDLSPEQLHKLQLAARADKIRFASEIDQLRKRLDASSGDLIQVQTILQETSKLRTKLQNPFGPDSFFAKAASKILEGAPSKVSLFSSSSYLHDDDDPKDRAHRRHISNVESAIRAVDRRIVLRPRQQEAIAKLLIKEAKPPKTFGDFDDILVKYRLSQLPEDKLKPLFDEAQWPRVREVLDGFVEFRPGLVRRGLIDEKPLKSPKRNLPADASRPDYAAQTADATTPENRENH